MLVKNNNETILNEYIDYLKDKGKIIKIKDINKETNIKFSNGILFYFLSIVSVFLVILTIYLIFNFLINPSTDVENDAIIVIGATLFTMIIIGITLYEKKFIKLNVTYPNENQIKVNNKIFDIEKDNCFINIKKEFEKNVAIYNNVDIYNNVATVNYFLIINVNNHSKSFKITNGTEEQLKDFIYNFEYEFSDFQNKKNESLKNFSNVLEELYDTGSVSEDSIEKLSKYIDEEK